MPSRAPVQTGTDAPELPPLSRLFCALANGRRRRIVSLLETRPDGVTLGELATKVASAEAGVPLRAVSDERFERVLCSLKHHHLPELHAVGLIEREDDDRIALADVDEVRDGLVGTVLDVADSDAETGTALELLASERRVIVLERLRSWGTATVSDLVTAVTRANDDAARRRARVSLVHTHLPRLAAAGVVDYERGEPADRRRIVYVGLPAATALLDWLDDERTSRT